jgi:hypothetical protein
VKLFIKNFHEYGTSILKQKQDLIGCFVSAQKLIEVFIVLKSLVAHLLTAKNDPHPLAASGMS